MFIKIIISKKHCSKTFPEDFDYYLYFFFFIIIKNSRIDSRINRSSIWKLFSDINIRVCPRCIFLLQMRIQGAVTRNDAKVYVTRRSDLYYLNYYYNYYYYRNYCYNYNKSHLTI